ncbi:MAG: PIN domain nuclease [Desulfobacteraceae bacterium]|jgi:predicted nucleic acid-binding protein|nr:MAG: PIN domain nuclease [Desulfobacteraceae bacterium]
MVLVDSSVWIDYFNGAATRQTEILDQMLQQIPLITGDLILVEVLQGFRDDNDFKKAQEIMGILPCREMCGHDIAIQSAENYRKLRKKGITVRKTIDVIIGTFCIAEKIPLLHTDKDFDPMVEYLGLKTII